MSNVCVLGCEAHEEVDEVQTVIFYIQFMFHLTPPQFNAKMPILLHLNAGFSVLTNFIVISLHYCTVAFFEQIFHVAPLYF